MGVATGVMAAALVWASAPVTALAAQPSTWNFQQADVAAAQPLGEYGHGVLVAVVDTWVDPTQPAFGGRVVDEADCVTGTCSDHSYAPDSCVHGTHVAGTVASTDYGVAPEADILAVQVLSGPAGPPDPSASCSGSVEAVAAGIDFAVAKGARAINLSLGDAVPGLFESSAIQAAVSRAANHGALVVFAAGNSGVPLTDSYGNDALIVAATGPSGQLAGYSNFNTALTGSVNVAAPGGDSANQACTAADCILSTFPDNRLGLLEGTSMAAPHVTGLAALLLAQQPGRTPAQVASAIESTARPLAGAGSGLIDAARALRLAPAPSSSAAGTAASGAGTPVTTAGSAGASSSAAPPATSSSRAPAGSVAVAAGSSPVDTGPGGATEPAPVTAGIGAPTAGAASTVDPPVTGQGAGQTRTALGTSPPVAAGPKRAAATSAPASGWADRHAGLLALAFVLLAAGVAALAIQIARPDGPVFRSRLTPSRRAAGGPPPRPDRDRPVRRG